MQLPKVVRNKFAPLMCGFKYRPFKDLFIFLAMMYGLTMSLKNEIVKIAPKGRVNSIGPGWVRTVECFFVFLPRPL